MNLTFIGDVMLGRRVNESLKTMNPEDIWGDTLPILRQADARICNLECVLSDRGTPWNRTPKMFHFRSDAKNIKVLEAAGIDIVSTANNHALDYSQEALVDMLCILDEHGIANAGAGVDRTEAKQAAIISKQNTKIGFLAFTDGMPEWEANEDHAGVFYMPVDAKDARAKQLFTLVEKTKDIVDILIVSAHWGPNWGEEPPETHPPFARALIDHGADIIYGHSSHVTRGIEVYHDKPILYGTGDFIDDYAVDEKDRNDESCLFSIDFYDGTCQEIRCYPAYIQETRTHLARGTRKERIGERMRILSKPFGTEFSWSEDGDYLTYSC